MAMGYIGGAVFLGALLYVAGKASPLTKEEKAGARAAGHKLGTIIGVAGLALIGLFYLLSPLIPDNRTQDEKTRDERHMQILRDVHGTF